MERRLGLRLKAQNDFHGYLVVTRWLVTRAKCQTHSDKFHCMILKIKKSNLHAEEEI